MLISEFIKELKAAQKSVGDVVVYSVVDYENGGSEPMWGGVQYMNVNSNGVFLFAET